MRFPPSSPSSRRRSSPTRRSSDLRRSLSVHGEHGRATALELTFVFERTHDDDLRVAHGALPSRPRCEFHECPPSYLASPDRKSTRLNSSHVATSYAVFCLKKKRHG